LCISKRFDGAAMSEQIMADLSRTCEGCGEVVTEEWAPGKVWQRCGADGPRRGYTVGNGRFLPYIPAWCPRMETEGRRGRNELL
jgi:hypothetical protein